MPLRSFFGQESLPSRTSTHLATHLSTALWGKDIAAHSSKNYTHRMKVTGPRRESHRFFVLVFPISQLFLFRGLSRMRKIESLLTLMLAWWEKWVGILPCLPESNPFFYGRRPAPWDRKLASIGAFPPSSLRSNPSRHIWQPVLIALALLPPCSHLRLCCLRSSLKYYLCNHSSVIDWRTQMDSCWENCDWWIAISRGFPCRWIRASRLCHWDSVGRIESTAAISTHLYEF